MENFTFNLGDLLNEIKFPSVTSKSVNLYNYRQYTFIVSKKLTKIQIKFVIEKIFNVEVEKVNTCILPIKKRKIGKFVGQRSLYKKAFIQLKQGNTIADLLN